MMKSQQVATDVAALLRARNSFLWIVTREEARVEREEAAAEERAIAEWFDSVQAVADAAMVAAGFHKHKGQWRRKRR